MTRDDEKELRLAVIYVFKHICGSPNQIHWEGKNGTISFIKDYLELSRNSGWYRLIKDALFSFMQCNDDNIPFTGDRRKYYWDKEKVIVPPGSAEYEMIADYMEDGHSIEETTSMLNHYR